MYSTTFAPFLLMLLASSCTARVVATPDPPQTELASETGLPTIPGSSTTTSAPATSITALNNVLTQLSSAISSQNATSTASAPAATGSDAWAENAQFKDATDACTDPTGVARVSKVGLKNAAASWCKTTSSQTHDGLSKGEPYALTPDFASVNTEWLSIRLVKGDKFSIKSADCLQAFMHPLNNCGDGSTAASGKWRATDPSTHAQADFIITV